MSGTEFRRRANFARNAILALGVTLLAVVLRLLLENALGVRLGVFVLLYPALTFVAVIGGLWPGVLTTVLGGLVAYFYVMPREFPDFSLRPAQISSTVAFIAVGIAFSIFSDSYRNSRVKAAAYDKDRALRESQVKLRRYQLFSENARDIIVFVRATDGQILEANDAAIAAYGYSREELLQLTIYDLRADKTLRLTDEQMALADARGILFETTHVRRNGESFPVEVSSRGADFDGERILISLVRDITERKRTEEALIRAEKLATVGRIAATVAHEINNPLEAVTNAVYLANLTLDTPDAARPYLEMADEELKRVSHITRQALGFYRESAGPERVSFGNVVDSTLNLLDGKIEAKQARIQREYDGDPVGFVVPGELRQVLSNLLVNSLDAIEPGGIIRIHISRTICAKTGQRYIRTTVADNGCGIAPETMPRIFEPLFTTKESIGTGLGLWVSRQIVEKHQGSIRVRSSINSGRRGTVVSFVLPAEEAFRLKPAPEVPIEAVSQTGQGTA
ncbi:MAG TPA: ATP-binding protein [Candidatus Acidoferrales bacterium]|nr:ATP-binding protein [Candidatus Acidoferrales bacterium]